MRIVSWAAGIKAANAPAVNIEANAADGRKKARGVQPGSFMSLMINSKHQDGRGVSDEEATSQAFTFLLAGYETTVRLPSTPDLCRGCPALVPVAAGHAHYFCMLALPEQSLRGCCPKAWVL